MKLLFCMMFMFLLTACTPKVVYLPVYSCPAVNIPQMQQLSYRNVDQKNVDAVLKAYIVDIKYLEGYSSQLTVLLNGYNEKGNK